MSTDEFRDWLVAAMMFIGVVYSLFISEWLVAVLLFIIMIHSINDALQNQLNELNAELERLRQEKEQGHD